MANNFRDNLYQFVSEYIQQNGSSPSFAEITAAMEISPRSKSLITRNLRMLEKERRLIRIRDGRRLLIKLPNKQVQLLGSISAGQPIEAIPEYEFIDIEHLFRAEDRFALLVKGISMIDEGILDGDMIICRKSDTAKEGDIVVALIDQNHTTLKRISYRVKGMITLIPANQMLKPRAYTPDRIGIQGVYIGLIRIDS